MELFAFICGTMRKGRAVNPRQTTEESLSLRRKNRGMITKMTVVEYCLRYVLRLQKHTALTFIASLAAPRAWRQEREARAADAAMRRGGEEDPRPSLCQMREELAEEVAATRGEEEEGREEDNEGGAESREEREEEKERQEKRSEGAEVFPRGDQATVVPASNTRSPKGRVEAP